MTKAEEVRRQLIKQAQNDKGGPLPGTRERQRALKVAWRQRLYTDAAAAPPIDLPFGLPTVVAALVGTATIEEMAFSLGIPVLEPHEVADFCRLVGSKDA
jgi:hypothetical protein